LDKDVRTARPVLAEPADDDGGDGEACDDGLEDDGEDDEEPDGAGEGLD
jgi:hypothetical protein